MKISKSPAILSIDLIFTWHSQIAKRECQCRLRIYKTTFDTSVVIVSELPDNQGSTIITDETLTLIHLVCNKFALYPTKTMWLKGYPKGHFQEEETYEQVMLLQNNVWTKRIKKEKIEDLLGVKLEL